MFLSHSASLVRTLIVSNCIILRVQFFWLSPSCNTLNRIVHNAHSNFETAKLHKNHPRCKLNEKKDTLTRPTNETSPINIAWPLALFNVRFNFSCVCLFNFIFFFCYFQLSAVQCAPNQWYNQLYAIIVFLDHVRWVIDWMGLKTRNHFSALQKRNIQQKGRERQWERKIT